MRLQTTAHTVAITALCLLCLDVGTCSAQVGSPYGGGVQLRFNGGGISIGGGGIGISIGGGYYPSNPSYSPYYGPRYQGPSYYGQRYFEPSYLPPSYYSRPQYHRYNYPQYHRQPYYPSYPGNRGPSHPPMHQQRPSHNQPHHHHR